MFGIEMFSRRHFVMAGGPRSLKGDGSGRGLIKWPDCSCNYSLQSAISTAQVIEGRSIEVWENEDVRLGNGLLVQFKTVAWCDPLQFGLGTPSISNQLERKNI